MLNTFVYDNAYRCKKRKKMFRIPSPILLLFICIFMHATVQDIAGNRELRRHFNRVMTVHIEGIGFALARSETHPHVDPQKGLARFWEEIAFAGGIDALVENAEVYVLAQELHLCVMNKPACIEAMETVRELQQSGTDADTLERARFRVHVAYVGGIMEEANLRGCPFRRPDSAPKLSEMQLGQGGSFAATEAKNWGNIAYLADLLQANADLDVATHDSLLKAFALAQLIYRAENM
jgi:hypothetical protein